MLGVLKLLKLPAERKKNQRKKNQDTHSFSMGVLIWGVDMGDE